MIVHFVRHGETAYNRQGLGLGRANVPLNERGRRQAALVAARFADRQIDHVYSSPLERCLATAAAIAGERGVTVEAREELIELDVGDTEGLTFAVMRERYPSFLAEWAGPGGHHARMPGGESLADLRQRVDTFLGWLREARPHSEAVVVAHNFVIRVAIASLLGLDTGAFRCLGADVASISTVRLRGDGSAVLRSLNDRCHLRDLEP